LHRPNSKAGDSKPADDIERDERRNDNRYANGKRLALISERAIDRRAYQNECDQVQVMKLRGKSGVALPTKSPCGEHDKGNREVEPPKLGGCNSSDYSQDQVKFKLYYECPHYALRQWQAG
jgi:hypothetical protein